jgi:hypothetical protein
VNRNQWLLVIIVIALALPLLFLEWSDGWDSATRILVFYEAPPRPPYDAIDRWGLYTTFGVAGILLGAIAPICLFMAAAFVWLGRTTD